MRAMRAKNGLGSISSRESSSTPIDETNSTEESYCRGTRLACTRFTSVCCNKVVLIYNDNLAPTF